MANKTGWVVDVTEPINPGGGVGYVVFADDRESNEWAIDTRWDLEYAHVFANLDDVLTFVLRVGARHGARVELRAQPVEQITHWRI